MPICSLILPPVSVSCTVSFLFVLSGARFFRASLPFLLPHNSFSFSSFPSFLSLFSAPSLTFTSPSLLAFQLSIRDRFTQLTFLSLLEPLDFRPFGFSPSFSLLMSTFLLLIAPPLLTDSFSSLYRTLYYLANSAPPFPLHFPYWGSLFATDASVTISASSIYGAIHLL